MKKKFLKLLFTISLVFSFIPFINADVTGSNCINVGMNKTSCAIYNGFQTNVDVCHPTWDGKSFYQVASGSTYWYVSSQLRNPHFTRVQTSDGKGGSTTIKYYYCGGSNENSRVNASVTCKVSLKVEVATVSLEGKNQVRGSCAQYKTETYTRNQNAPCGVNCLETNSWKDKKGLHYTCKCTNVTDECIRYNYYCPSGYPNYRGVKCYANCPSNAPNLYDRAYDLCYASCPYGLKFDGSLCVDDKEEVYDYEEVGNNLRNSVTLKKLASDHCYNYYNVETPLAQIKCDCSEAEYDLECKAFDCKFYPETINVTTPSFQLGQEKEPAYCVNPSLGFASNYGVDNDFDVTNCQTSYSTVDCGYANIMIEAAYHNKVNKTNINTKAIELAMRLWGKHSGAGGYGGIGISSYNGTATSGDNCVPNITFLPNEDNIYEVTLNKIWKAYMDSITNNTKSNSYIKDMNYLTDSDNYVDVRNANDIFNTITCNNAENSLVCGSSSVYKQAFALFFNTALGNKYMKEHLDYIYGNEVNTRPDKVDVETSEEQNDKGEFVKGETNIVLTFDRTVTNTTKTEYNCKDVKKDAELPLDKRTYKDLTDSQRAYILQYCTVKVDNFCVYNDETKKCEKIDVNDNDKIYDASKGQIIIDTEYFAVCTSENKNKYKEYQVSVNYKRPVQGTSVRKYETCSNASVNQTMFAFVNAENNKDVTNSEEQKDDSYYYPTEEYSVSLNCTGNCTDYSIKTSAPKCQDNDGGVYTGYVRDPSLKCIVNMYSDTNKSYYDYSEYFKVNTNLCRVYCADEVNYYIADKLTVSSGRSFTYDIKPGGVLENKDNKISSIIEEKRRCVSEIYYNKNFPESIDWKKLYGITDKDLEDAFPSGEKSINNIQDLLTVLFIKSQKENSRDENINQILYDLYNCNLYTEEAVKNTEQEKNGQVVIKENIIRQPQDNKTGNLNKYLKNLYSSENHYGLNNDITNTITYEGGAQYINNKNRFIGTNSDDIKVEKEIRSNLSDISYCSGDNCLEYDVSASQDDNYAYDKFKDESTTATVKNAIEVKKTLTGLTERLNDLYITKIPINDYAMFYTSIQIDFYNDSEFKMEALTGEVKKSTDEGSLDVVALDKYSYPTSKDAYNSGKCKVIDSNVARCDITQTINNMTTYYRRRSLDSFSKYLTSTDFTKLTCHIDVTRPSVLPQESQSGNADSITDSITKYRNVKLSDLFPNGDRINSNWATEYGKIAKNEIEKSSSQINSDLYLEYSFDLTPQSIREIKSYNRKVEGQGGYLNDTKISGTCTQKDNKFFNCKSSFLEEIRGGSSLYVNNNDQKNKFDGISKYTAEKK